MLRLVKKQSKIEKDVNSFENKTFLAFTRRCSTKRALFLRAKESRNTPNCRRELHSMNDAYRDNFKPLNFNISLCFFSDLSIYWQPYKTLPNYEFEIIGYAMKPPTTDNLDTKVKELNNIDEDTQETFNQKAVLEMLAVSNRVSIYDSEMLLKDLKLLERFECKIRLV
ncbi:hypothetical protein BY458DRAFT_488661 [Sporodiniella umbellata]|nr:hypothetical protein BY458DRAFT_488661 [Sporodiniella umbellata]